MSEMAAFNKKKLEDLLKAHPTYATLLDTARNNTDSPAFHELMNLYYDEYPDLANKNKSSKSHAFFSGIRTDGRSSYRKELAQQKKELMMGANNYSYEEAVNTMCNSSQGLLEFVRILGTLTPIHVTDGESAENEQELNKYNLEIKGLVEDISNNLQNLKARLEREAKEKNQNE